MVAASPSRTSRMHLVMVFPPLLGGLAVTKLGSRQSGEGSSDKAGAAPLMPSLSVLPLLFFATADARLPTPVKISLQVVAGLEIDHCLALVEHDADGVAPGSHGVELTLEEAAQHDDARVCGGEMLLIVQRDRPLAHHRLVVAGEAAVLLLAQLLPELAVEAGAHAGELARLAHAGRCVDAEAGVVDRQHPADRLDAAVAADLGIGDDPQRRQHGLADAAEGAAVLQLA